MDLITRNTHEQCIKLMYHHVILSMSDGSSFDGIIEAVDQDNISVLVGEDVMEEGESNQETRQYYGYDGGGYGRPRRRFRRFRRRRLPLAFITSLS